MADATPILRLIHIDNLEVCLRREALYAPNFEPRDGLHYRTIHDVDIQVERKARPVPCGPCGVVHDYVPFYFGPLSPMMLKLKTGQVQGYTEGQEPLIYLVSNAQAVAASGTGFVFTNGHGIARFTDWFADLNRLDEVDWKMVSERYWNDTLEDPDRKRRKQAEFLVHRSCPWDLIQEIRVMNDTIRKRTESVMEGFDQTLRRTVVVQRDWYYY